FIEGEPVTRVELLQFIESEVLHFAAPIGCAVHCIVMDDNDMAVTTCLHIEFCVANAKSDSTLEGDTCILRCLATCATVGKEPRLWTSKEGCHALVVAKKTQ